MSDNALPTGTRLGDSYEVRSVLGRGGFGITYKAWDVQLHRFVAIKEYFPYDLAVRAAGSTKVVPRDASTKDDFAKGMVQFVQVGRTLAKFTDEHRIRQRGILLQSGTLTCGHGQYG